MVKGQQGVDLRIYTEGWQCKPNQGPTVNVLPAIRELLKEHENATPEEVRELVKASTGRTVRIETIQEKMRVVL